MLSPGKRAMCPREFMVFRIDAPRGELAWLCMDRGTVPPFRPRDDNGLQRDPFKCDPDRPAEACVARQGRVGRRRYLAGV